MEVAYTLLINVIFWELFNFIFSVIILVEMSTGSSLRDYTNTFFMTQPTTCNLGTACYTFFKTDL